MPTLVWRAFGQGVYALADPTRCVAIPASSLTAPEARIGAGWRQIA